MYMVCLAFHAVYLRNRVALQLGPQSALSALVWFSRVQAAEPLLFHAVMFAVSSIRARPPSIAQSQEAGNEADLRQGNLAGCVSFPFQGAGRERAAAGVFLKGQP